MCRFCAIFMNFGRGHDPLHSPMHSCSYFVVYLPTCSLMQIFNVTSKEDTTSLSYLPHPILLQYFHLPPTLISVLSPPFKNIVLTTHVLIISFF